MTPHQQSRLERYALDLGPKLIAAIYAAIVLAWLIAASAGAGGSILPFANDFMTFWAAARLAAGPESMLAYDIAAQAKIHHEMVPGSTSFFMFLYPPTFLLLVLPLGLLPYLAALAAWLTATATAAAATLRRLAPHPYAPWLFAAAPGSLMCLLNGQNGFLSLALFGGALQLLDRRPYAAGLLLALLAYKPQFGALVPLVLIATGRWRVMIGAGAAAGILVALSVAVFGPEIWPAFAAAGRSATADLAAGSLPLEKMVTLFAALRLAGLSGEFASGIHLATALAVAVAACVAWRGPAPHAVKSALLVVGSLLVAPYAYYYDLVMLGAPAAWLGWLGYRDGFRRCEVPALVLAWALPPLTLLVTATTGVQIAWLGLLGLFLVLWRRCRAAPALRAR